MQLIRFTFNEIQHRIKAFEIRREVFINEQKVNMEEEFDEFDATSLHYLVIKDSSALGTARWRFTEGGIKLERFAVRKEKRGEGVGQFILREMLDEMPKDLPCYLHAQVSALPFYEKNGFEKTGPMFQECDIDHFKMVYRKSETSHNLSLTQSINFVKEFHTAFGLPVNHNPVVKVDEELIRLRHRLMEEENNEYLQAALAGDLVEVADALGDILYILNGSIITHGLQNKIGEVYKEIQRSNMSKLDENGKPIYREDGKVMKSSLYFRPNIAEILK